jgi:5-methylcytosine-specific restriction endonuclease McrA
MIKRCPMCKKWKLKSEFYKNKAKNDGLATECKPCALEAARKWKATNSDKKLEYQRKWYAKNPEKVRDRNRKWAAANPERRSDYARNYSTRHPEKKRERLHKWQAENPEKISEYYHSRKALKKANGGRFTAAEWRALKEFYGFACLACGMREPDAQLQPDHVKPLAKGGSNSIDNIQPLCPACNRKKNVKHIDYRKVLGLM